MFILNPFNINSMSEKSRIHYKRHALIMAVLLLICGICCLIYPFIAGLYLSNVIGMLLMASGFYTLYCLLVFRQQTWKSRFISLVFAIAWLMLGYSFVANPLVGISSLAIVFCCLFIVGGLLRMVSGFALRGRSGGMWSIFIGIFDLLIAAVWLRMNPEQSYLFTTAFIGLEMIFSAAGLIFWRKKLASAASNRRLLRDSH